MIGQVAKSYLLVKIGNVLAAIDQHAADERVKLEGLLAAVPSTATITTTTTTTTTATSTDAASGTNGTFLGCIQGVKMINETIQVTALEYLCMNNHREVFVDDWRFLYEEDVTLDMGGTGGSSNTSSHINHASLPLTHQPSNNEQPSHDHESNPPCLHWLRVTQVPLVFEQGEALTSGDLLEFVRAMVSEIHSPTPRSLQKPPCISRIAASMACRTAIKFGHALTPDQCAELMSNLSKTQLPFQCAHGRPSVVPLLQLM